MNIEDAFSSKIRMRILRILNNVGELNGSEIARRVGVNYVSASKHLNILESEGVLQHKMYGRIRLYRYVQSSPRAKAVQELIDIWEKENKK